MDLTPYVEGWRRRFAEERERSDRDRERVPAALRAAGPELAREVGARRVYLFGSWAWGRPPSRSDVDIAVEGVPHGRSERVREAAERLLEPVLHREIDARRVEELPDRIRERLLHRGIVLYVEQR